MNIQESTVFSQTNLPDEESGYAFFSYSREDRMGILNLSTFLKREELLPWADNQLKLGDVWQKELENKITDCRLFVILMSQNSRKSKFVKWEIDQAIKLNKPILAIKLNNEELFEEFKEIKNLKSVYFWDFAKPNWRLAETIRKLSHPNQIPSQRLMRQRLEFICLYLFEELYNVIPDGRFFIGGGAGMQFNVSVDKSLSDLTTEKWLQFFSRVDKIFGWKIFVFPENFDYFRFYPTIEKVIDFMLKSLIWDDIKHISFIYS
jgi:hypothetical protein